MTPVSAPPMDALQEAYRTHRDLWSSMARIWAGNAADAEDAVAEALTRVAEHLSAGNPPPSNWSAYVLAAVRNVLITRAGSAYGRRAVLTADPDLDAAQESPHRDAAPADAAVADIDVMRRVLGELPEDTRQMLWLIEVEGYGREEVAALYGATPNTVSVRLSRARQVLRNAFIGQSIDPGHSAACAAFTVDLAARATGTLRPRADRRLDAHLAGCAECRSRSDQASLAAARYAGTLIPALAWLLADGDLVLDASPRPGHVLSRPSTSAAAVGVAAAVTALLLWAPWDSGPAPVEAASAPSASAPAGDDATPGPEAPPAPSAPGPAPSPEPEDGPAPGAAGITTRPAVLTLDASAAPADGTLTVTAPARGVPQTAALSLPSGVRLVAATGWTCADGPDPRCTIPPGATSTTLTLAHDGPGAVGGAVTVIVTGTLDTDRVVYGEITSGVEIAPGARG